MSLVTTEFLRALYNEAQSGTYEHTSISFWGYLLSKVYFAEDHFYVDAQKPASPNDPLRRVDEQVKYFEKGTLKTRILCFHEGKKPSANTDDMQVVEGQAFEACATYCDFAGINHVYALTTIGTLARTWKYSHGTRQLEPLFGSAGLLNRAAYVDADSAHASQLDQTFRHMKMIPPSEVAELQQPRHHVYATGSR
ncbi:hypothetical protein K469DRAFT_611132 [Zopfia rhizophila CBS 207.26]|uniref:Fungal-type protein kinase domain-containing protein n=1 Tax=Zopfia rhizophila CBS 207.26 TaxID=1314779 RepID=A0A6A6DAW4_9PEZI|nr:hypothetical protein K469DRAFT_611132 [Zopfia rhizophila CBS 207.26]